MNDNLKKTETSVSHDITPDITQAEQFLALLGQGQEFTFQTFDDKKSKNHELAKVFHGTLEQHAQALIDLNHKGAGVFVMVNAGDGKTHDGNKTCRTNANVTKVRANFIDLDEDAQRKFDAVMESEAPPSIVVESSPNKYHCYWLVEDCPLESFKQVQQNLITTFDSDKSVNDLARVMRLPGFIHQKNTPFRTEFKHDLSSRKQYAKTDEVIGNAATALPKTYSVADKPSPLSNQIPEGQRNNTLTSMAGSMVTRGLNQAEIKTKLLEINTTQCCPPLPSNEVEDIAISVNRYRGTTNPNTKIEPLTDVGNANRFAKRFAGIVKYVKDAQCPRFIQFIQETFPQGVSQTNNDDDQNHAVNRQELLDYIQKALGYCLTGRTDQQCLMFGYGSGANGKTTLINVMLSLLGDDYAKQTPMDTLMVKNNKSSSNDLARLQHVRFVASTEVEDGSSMSESLIKQMTGGDRITARYLYKEFIEFTPKFKLFIAGNHKPIIRGSDEGIWRRIHLIPFEAKIPAHQRDGALQQKLEAELPGILNWLITGCIRWQKEGLTLPKVMEHAVTEYRNEMDTMGIWISDCCKTGPGLTMRAQNAFDSYRKWLIDNEFNTCSSAAFYRKLSERFTKNRDSKGNYYDGITC